MSRSPAWTRSWRIPSCNTWRRSNKTDGATVICSLHFLDLVHRYATRVIALKDGIKVFEGLPKEIDRARFKEIYGEEAEEVRATTVEA